jgi:hypothetical protein
MVNYQVHGGRRKAIPPSAWDDINCGGESFTAERAVRRMILDGLSTTTIEKCVKEKFNLRHYEWKDIYEIYFQDPLRVSFVSVTGLQDDCLVSPAHASEPLLMFHIEESYRFPTSLFGVTCDASYVMIMRDHCIDDNEYLCFVRGEYERLNVLKNRHVVLREAWRRIYDSMILRNLEWGRYLIRRWNWDIDHLEVLVEDG